MAKNKKAHHMKLFLLLFFSLTLPAAAGEYRFRCIGEVTGLCDFVYDAQGKETTIVIARNSDPECLALFKALQQKRIYGTKGMEDHMGAKWEQAIILTGEFTSKPKRTKSAPNMAASEEYRDFKITGLKLRFPVSRFAEIREEGEFDGPVLMETHFGFESLFPQGVKFVGKTIELSNHVEKHPDSK